MLSLSDGSNKMNRCLICNNSSLAIYKKAGQDYLMKQCLKCKIVFDLNASCRANKLYSESYFTSKITKGGYFNYIEESAVNKLTFNHRLKTIEERLGRKGQLLDIGCALGDFLEVSRDKLWRNSYGTEISDYAIKQCHKKGLKVYKLNLQKKQRIFPKNSLDVVTMQDVVEHLKNPKQELREVYNLLKPGGLLFITTPNLNSLSQKLMGRYWYHYKKGEHLIYFNSDNIALLLKKSGFKNIQVKPTLSWVTIQYIIHRLSYYFPRLSSEILEKLSNNLLFKISFPINTGEIEVWARKP